ncbi:phosphoribosylanthranilate isomerase [Paenibacillus koleovorans]|uniref:phosphoribosylanthranilate isomerase n=1 Tax=Paenibacillus koleovorans TaxID=121608 RepID=UPI000FD71312|nr:phosphoribosylanthranilate isomerase [Paenibacillus koleovorans]
MATVKICGLQDVEVLKSILHLPIDQIGFIFAKSRRQVSPAQAGELIRELKAHEEVAASGGGGGGTVPLTVGVFVNPTPHELAETLREAPLDIVQLHGKESAELCRFVKSTLGARVMKVVSIGGADGSSVEEQLAPYAGSIDMLLLDTFEPHVGGGSGQTFAWDRIPPYLEWTRRNGIPLLVAGGLNAGNVEELIRDYAPDGVDVSSGVETDGIKEVTKIIAFVERVKQHASSAG